MVNMELVYDANLFEGIHGGSMSNMNAVILIGISFTPTIQYHHPNHLGLGQLWMILQLP